MTYLYSNSALYLPEKNEIIPKMLFSDPKSLCLDFKSNRITRKGQLIEEESVFRRMKAESLLKKAHREDEIAAMRIKYQLEELDELRKNNFRPKISRQAQLVKEDNMMRLAEIEGCRTSRKPKPSSNLLQTPYYTFSSRK